MTLLKRSRNAPGKPEGFPARECVGLTDSAPYLETGLFFELTIDSMSGEDRRRSMNQNYIVFRSIGSNKLKRGLDLP